MRKKRKISADLGLPKVAMKTNTFQPAKRVVVDDSDEDVVVASNSCRSCDHPPYWFQSIFSSRSLRSQQISTPKVCVKLLQKEFFKRNRLQLTHFQELFDTSTSNNRYTVSRVFCVQNPFLWQLYRAHRDAVASCNIPSSTLMHLNGGRKPCISTAKALQLIEHLGLNQEVNEHLLFHGTRTIGRARIVVEQGFDERVAKLSGTLGGGSYFSDSPDVTQGFTPTVRGGWDSNSNGDCFVVLVARVVLGHPYFTTNNHASIRRPPCQSGHFSDDCGHPLFDSVVRESATRQMCIYDRYRAYPEFIVEYSNC